MAKSTSLDATWIDATIETSETTVTHGLGRTPVEAFIIRGNRGGQIYRGPTAWDGTNIYLRASTATAVRFLIF